MASMLHHPTHITSTIASRRANFHGNGHNDRITVIKGSINDPLSNTLPLVPIRRDDTATNSTFVKLQDVESTDKSRMHEHHERYQNELTDDQIYTGGSFNQREVPLLRNFKTLDEQNRLHQQSMR